MIALVETTFFYFLENFVMQKVNFKTPYSFVWLALLLLTSSNVNGQTLFADITPATTEISNDGIIDLTVNYGYAPYTFEWDNGETTEDIENLPPGAYTVNVYDRYCGVVNWTLNIHSCDGISLPFTIDETHINASNSTAMDGQINITVDGVSQGNYQYIWEDASGQIFSNDEDVSNLPVGFYTVIVQDACGATTELTIEITSCEINIEIDVTDESVLGASDGSINLSVSGQNPFSFNWSNGEITEDISNLSEGLYSVTITYLDGTNSCIFEYDIIVEPGNACQDCYPIDASIGLGSIHVHIECLETYGFSYQWSDGGTGNPRTDLAVGTYCVTATSNNGCVQTGCWDVESECDSAPVTDSNVDVTHSCVAAPMSGSLEVLNPQQNLYYFWEGPNNLNVEGAFLNNLFPGEYCLSITGDVFGSPCPMAAGCFTIESDGDQCCDDCYPIDANINQGNIFVNVECLESGGFTFEWSDGGTGSYRQNLDVGTYCVTITSLSGDCSMSGCWDIIQECPPTQHLIDLNADIFCSSGDNGSIELKSLQFNSDAFPIWTDSDGYFVGSGYELTNMPPGEYCVEIMETIWGGCLLAEGCFTIDETDLRARVDAIQNPEECDGYCSTNVSLSVSSSSSNLTYEWTGPDGFTTITKDLFNVCVGDYSVTISDGTDCSVVLEASICCCNWDFSSSIGDPSEDFCFYPNFSLPPLEVTLESLTQLDPANGVTTGSIDISTNVPNSPDNSSPNYYEWSGPNFTSFDEDINNLVAGYYCVTVSSGCESVEECYLITDCGTINWSMIREIEPSCPGADAGIVTISNVIGGTGNYEYRLEGQPTNETGMFTGLAMGNYTVTVYDTESTCEETQDFTIGEAEPVINVEEVIWNTCVGYNYGSIFLDVTGDYPDFTFEWSNGQETETASELAVGEYYVTITDARGCRTVAGPFEVDDSEVVGPLNEGEDVFNCTEYLYCNFNVVEINQNQDVSDYDPEDCTIWENLCQEANGDTYYYYPSGPGSNIEDVDLEWGEPNFFSCQVSVYCADGSLDEIVYGDIETEGLWGQDFSSFDCYYCFTAQYCYIEVDGVPMSGLVGSGNIINYINVAQEVPSDCEGTPPNASCYVNIYCSIPGSPSTLAQDLCDLNCNAGSTEYECSNLTSIAEENLRPSPPMGREEKADEKIIDDFIIEINPNPFESEIAVEINSKINRNLVVKIYNVAGVIVKTIDYLAVKGTQVFHIKDMDSLASGVYYLRIIDIENKDFKSFPIVKQ